MRRVRPWFPALVVLAVGAACGGETPTPHETDAAGPSETPVVRYPFTLQVGDGVRLTLRAEVEVTASGSQDRQETLQVDMTLALRCSDVSEAGERVARLRMDTFAADAAPVVGVDPGIDGSMTIGPDRQAKSVEMGGQAMPRERPLANPFVTGGQSIYLPLPADGMRVGEAVALPPEMPTLVLPPFVQHALEGAADAPALRGSYTLVGTHERDGLLIGDFDIDISLRYDGQVLVGSGEMDLLVDMACEGRQSFAFGTGLPVGEGRSRVVQRVEMKLGDQESVMRTTAEIRSTCEAPAVQDPASSD